jgi:hypothetical protein
MTQLRRSALPSVGQDVRSTTGTGDARPPRFRTRMNLRYGPSTISPIAVAVLALGLLTPLAAGNDVVDPFDVIAAVDGANRLKLWPGFDVTAYPVAIFDGTRTLLLRHPSPPEGFEHLEGHDGVWVYSGKHPAMRWNSNADIGGVRTATLLLTIEPGRSVEYEAHILYHEIFHLFSKPLHPSWTPNEMWRFSYPMGDLENYRQLLLEEEALARAVESSSDEEAASWAVAALEIRTDRQERLRQEHLTFETLLELQEGTAVYMGRSTIGIATETERLREDRGPDGIRWRCYETGAAVAVILDRLLPGWKVELDAKPETTLTGLLKKAVKAADVQAASFSDDELARTSARAEGAVAELTAKRAQLYQVFDERGKKVIVRLSSDGERFAFGRFDPMAVEVLEHGEALHANLLTSTHPRGEFRLTNPHFARRSLDGVIAFTSPAGEHPFLQGYQKIAVSGFQGEPAVERTGSVVSVEAEGLSISFDGAEVESTDEALIITVLPVDTSGVPPVK